MLHKLRPLIDRGKKAVLFFKTEKGETVKASIGKDAQGHYAHTLPSLPAAMNSLLIPATSWGADF